MESGYIKRVLPETGSSGNWFYLIRLQNLCGNSGVEELERLKYFSIGFVFAAIRRCSLRTSGYAPSSRLVWQQNSGGDQKRYCQDLMVSNERCFAQRGLPSNFLKFRLKRLVFGVVGLGILPGTPGSSTSEGTPGRRRASGKYPCWWNATSSSSPRRAAVIIARVFEVDARTGRRNSARPTGIDQPDVDVVSCIFCPAFRVA